MQLPKLKYFKLYEPIPDVPGANFDFKGTYTDAAGDTHNVTVFDTDYFVKNIIMNFRGRFIALPEENTEAYFKALFDTWKASRSALYFKQAYAYTLKYNPIENYSSVENLIDDITEHEKGASSKTEYNNSDTDELTPFTKETTETTPYTKETTETTPYTKEVTETTPYTKEVTETTPYTKEVTETTPYTKETTTTTGAVQNTPSSTTTTSRKAFDSSSWAEVEKSDTAENSKVEFAKTGTEKVEFAKTGTEKVEFAKTGTEKVEFSKTGTEKVELTKTGTEKREISHDGYVETTTDGTDTDTRNYTLTKKGNIGVMTPAEMLQKEFDGLMQDLAWRALTEFVDRYSFYSTAVE